MSLNQVAFTTDGHGNKYNVRIWDMDSSAPIASYQGGVSQSRSLNFINDEYIISAQRDKTAFSLWSFRQYDQVNRKFAAPGKVQCLSVSPCGTYAIAGIECGLYFWEISCGTLIGVTERHYQPVTNVKFSSDGETFVTAGMDSTINVWRIGVISNFISNEDVVPRATFKEHSHPILDVCVRRSMVAAVSSANYLTIHDLRNLSLVFEKNFNERLSCLTLEYSLSAVFVGCDSGKIIRTSLNDGEESEFLGHTASVKCLDISADDSTILSGSEDCSARIWESKHGHTIHVLKHDGIVTNAVISSLPPDVLIKGNNHHKSCKRVTNFQRAVSIPEKFVVGYQLNLDDKLSDGFHSFDSPNIGIVDKATDDQVLQAKINTQLMDYFTKELLDL